MLGIVFELFLGWVEKRKNNQKEKNQSVNGLKRTIWRGCIQLKINSFVLKSVWMNIEWVFWDSDKQVEYQHMMF